MAVPFDRALGGRKVRNSRAGFAQAEKGLNLAVTSVMNLVIIAADGCAARRVSLRRRIGLGRIEFEMRAPLSDLWVWLRAASSDGVAMGKIAVTCRRVGWSLAVVLSDWWQRSAGAGQAGGGRVPEGTSHGGANKNIPPRACGQPVFAFLFSLKHRPLNNATLPCFQTEMKSFEDISGPLSFFSFSSSGGQQGGGGRGAAQTTHVRNSE